jgi:hypothetical protein
MSRLSHTYGKYQYTVDWTTDEEDLLTWKADIFVDGAKSDTKSGRVHKASSDKSEGMTIVIMAVETALDAGLERPE